MNHLAALFLLLPGTLTALTLEEAAQLAPLPESTRHGGAFFADLNADGHPDLVVSNPVSYGVYLFNPVEKKNVRWDRGWTEVLREGDAGDENALPLLVDPKGNPTGVVLREGALTDSSGRIILTKEDLLSVPAPAPLSAEASLRKLILRQGYEAKLVAQEPLVQDPVFVDWDERGRMWVVEMGDYPFAPGETTTDGKVGQGKVSNLQTGRIKILTDENEDGVYDRATTFLEGLRHPTGLTFWKGGVFISAIPDIFYARDTDDDGMCDEREVWYTGFTAGNPQHLVNGFAWGLDGWFYGANGDSGGEITNVKTGARIKLGSNDFRFHPVTREFRLETGRTQYGKWRDDYGNWFGNNNVTLAWHYHIPMAWMEANPEQVPPQIRALVSSDVRVHTISPPMRRFNHANATNVLTAACSPMPWNDGTFDTLIVCEPANNLVRQDVLSYETFPISSQRHPQDKKGDFIASADNWFRPVQVREGPDGALYLVDMYRLVLEHPEWIPAGISKGIDLRAGEDQGRIIRISQSKREYLAVTQRLDLRSAMRSHIRWQRDLAQRRLIEQGDLSALSWLSPLVQDRGAPLASRLQAAWTAALLSEEHRPELIQLLKSGHPKVRAAALVAAKVDDVHPDELKSWFPGDTPVALKPAALPMVTRDNPDRTKVVNEFQNQVPELKGDPKKGESIFLKACAACHQLGLLGVEVGPNLATVAAKPAAQLIEAIFDPNRAVEQRNLTTKVTKKDGSILLGIATSEAPGAITLRLPGGSDVVVRRSDIRAVDTVPISLMPDGLEAALTAQDVADLLERIRSP